MLSKNKIKYIHSLELKKRRNEECVFVAEGPKLVADLLGHFDCRYIAATELWMERNTAALSSIIKNKCEVDLVTDEELRKASFLDAPQQVLAVFSQRSSEDTDFAGIVSSSLAIALDDVQNPGNLGTIIRLADWFGIEHIFCSKGSADVYNPKTIQATMGSIARVNVHYCDLEGLIKSLHSDTPVYGTFLDGSNIYDEKLEQKGIIVMGNEGRGVSEEIGKLVTSRLYVPNYPEDRETGESLNVAIATAIVCSEFRRRAL